MGKVRRIRGLYRRTPSERRDRELKGLEALSQLVRYLKTMKHSRARRAAGEHALDEVEQIGKQTTPLANAETTKALAKARAALRQARTSKREADEYWAEAWSICRSEGLGFDAILAEARAALETNGKEWRVSGEARAELKAERKAQADAERETWKASYESRLQEEKRAELARLAESDIQARTEAAKKLLAERAAELEELRRELAKLEEDR